MINGFTEDEDVMLGYAPDEEVELADYPQWRWVPLPASSAMVEAAKKYEGDIPRMLNAAWRAAPKPKMVS